MEGVQFYIKHLVRWLRKKELRHRLMHSAVNPQTPQPAEALDRALQWLKASQDATPDGGCSTLYPATGWVSSYPETTGYIVETWIHSLSLKPDPEMEGRIYRALDWLVEIQRPSGGWQSGYIHQERPEVVFNTGQIIRGMWAGWRHFQEERWRAAAIRACDWLVSIQHPIGYWDQHVYLNAVRVYDTYVAAPLMKVGQDVGNEAYVAAALRHAAWVKDHKMLSNGWLEDADNTLAHNDRPILHTLAYTYDGLVDMALMAPEQLLVEELLAGPTLLAQRWLRDRKLHGRYDRTWKGYDAMLLTGCAQMAIVWFKLNKAGVPGPWKEAAETMVQDLCSLQEWQIPEALGALPGSNPIWGRYEPFGYPNWATKYLADALMLQFAP